MDDCRMTLEVCPSLPLSECLSQRWFPLPYPNTLRSSALARIQVVCEVHRRGSGEAHARYTMRVLASAWAGQVLKRATSVLWLEQHCSDYAAALGQAAAPPAQVQAPSPSPRAPVSLVSRFPCPMCHFPRIRCPCCLNRGLSPPCGRTHCKNRSPAFFDFQAVETRQCNSIACRTP